MESDRRGKTHREMTDHVFVLFPFSLSLDFIITAVFIVIVAVHFTDYVGLCSPLLSIIVHGLDLAVCSSRCTNHCCNHSRLHPDHEHL